jgi:acyl-CoA synthetase (NDP forming)
MIALFTPALSATAAEVQEAVDGVARDVGVPVLSVVFGAAAERDGGGAAQFTYPEAAAGALSAAARLADWRQAPADEPPALEDVRPGEATELLAAAVSDGERWLSDRETSALLDAWGVPVVETVRASTPAEAGRAAASLGGTVALKAVGEGIVHKSDLGAVQIGLEGEDAVRRAAQGMSRRLRRRGLPPQGFLVQRQVSGGVEMLAGITADPLLGPLVACAAGGTVVELIGDVSVRLAPVGRAAAAEMVRALATFPLLDGYRGARPADVKALEELIVRLGALAGAHPEILELDCNPVMVLERDAVVVDARVRVAPPRARPPWPAVGAEPPAVSSSHGSNRWDGAEAEAEPAS